MVVLLVATVVSATRTHMIMIMIKQTNVDAGATGMKVRGSTYFVEPARSSAGVHILMLINGST